VTPAREHELLERIDQLKHDNWLLERELGAVKEADKVRRFRDALALTPSAATVLTSLHALRGKTLSRERILAMLYPDGDEPDAGKVLDVFVWSIRKAIGKGGVGVTWGVGWFLTESGLAECDRIAALAHVPPRMTARHGRREVSA
jgi:DNA-binding response OmpR family regulator